MTGFIINHIHHIKDIELDPPTDRQTVSQADDHILLPLWRWIVGDFGFFWESVFGKIPHWRWIAGILVLLGILSWSQSIGNLII